MTPKKKKDFKIITKGATDYEQDNREYNSESWEV